MPSACRTVQAAPKEVNGKCIFPIILNILGSILMSQRQAIVTFPQRQIQLVTRENNHCCKPTISTPPPPPPSALPNPRDENRVLCQLKKQMGKGEGFRAAKHRSPGSSFSLYPLWASILETFTDLDLTYRNVSASFEVGGRTNFTVFPLFQFIQRLGQALQMYFCAWVFCCFTAGSLELGNTAQAPLGCFLFLMKSLTNM